LIFSAGYGGFLKQFWDNLPDMREKDEKHKIFYVFLKKALDKCGFFRYCGIIRIRNTGSIYIPAVYEVRRPCSYLLIGMPYLLYFIIP
jgi:hypothetical protein